MAAGDAESYRRTEAVHTHYYLPFARRCCLPKGHELGVQTYVTS